MCQGHVLSLYSLPLWPHPGLNADASQRNPSFTPPLNSANSMFALGCLISIQANMAKAELFISPSRSSVSSVGQSCLTLCDPMDWLQHARPPCPSPTPEAYSNSRPSRQWCHPTISSSVVPFSSRLQSFPASGCFQMGQFFTSGGQSIGVSALAAGLPMNIQDWFPLGWTGWISLQSKGLSSDFSNTTAKKHKFFSA